MSWLGFLLSAAPATLPYVAVGQEISDTLPEQVIDRTYQAINRCDAAAYGSLYASYWYHSRMEDTARTPTRQTRDDAIRRVSELCKSFKSQFKMLQRIVLGPYVVDEQAALEANAVNLGIYEVRNGKIVRKWQSDLQRGASSQIEQPTAGGAETVADTMPERVIDRFYEAINRCDAELTGSHFASIWYHSALEDTASAPTRRTRGGFVRSLSEWCNPPKPRFKMLSRIVLGPYVVDQQAVLERGGVHFDIFRVLNGKIVHEWEGGPI